MDAKHIYLHGHLNTPEFPTGRRNPIFHAPNQEIKHEGIIKRAEDLNWISKPKCKHASLDSHINHIRGQVNCFLISISKAEVDYTRVCLGEWEGEMMNFPVWHKRWSLICTIHSAFKRTASMNGTCHRQSCSGAQHAGLHSDQIIPLCYTIVWTMNVAIASFVPLEMYCDSWVQLSGLKLQLLRFVRLE